MITYIYAAIIIYCLIGVGTSLIIANYQDDLVKVKTANGELPHTKSIFELIIGNFIIILMWPLMVYASLTWWQKQENNT